MQPSVASPHTAEPAQALAAACQALETVLLELHARLHASWRAPLVARWPALDAVKDEAVRRKLAARLLVDECGGMPPPDVFAQPEAVLAVVDPATLGRSLCALAVACRPGALRCCVERGVRQALTQALGGTREALESVAAQGRPVSHEMASWSPLQWACLGYVDWLQLPAARHRLLRRLLAVTLPHGLLGLALRRRAAARDFAPAAALRVLQGAGGPWPCFSS